jgi:transmembrane sensor
MQKKESHIDRKLEEQLNMLPGLDFGFEKSKDEVWAGLSRSIESSGVETSRSVVDLFPRRTWIAAAAVIFVLLGAASFMRLYTTDILASYGEHVIAQLPDGSTVELNAGSEIAYQPFWWFLNREVELEGEAFFEVEKGKTFRVNSPVGTTSVLGTSFNVYARNNEYQVTCYSGKVRVVAAESGHSLDIVPDEQATLTNDGGLRFSALKNKEEVVSWRSAMFMFTSTPIEKVFDEIERQYAVEIEAQELPDLLYSGNFSRNRPLEQVLKMVCRPYGLSYQKSSGGYLIIND